MELLVEFCLFLILQSFFINGVHFCFQKDNIFYRINPIFFENNKKKWWAYPIFSCIRCMSSVYGTITFWPVVVYVFGFNIAEIFVFFIDIGCLITLNFMIYKKL
jgi:hypothetical protein